MNKQILAQNIATTKARIEADGVTLKSLTDSLITIVGEGGETFSTPLGNVQVTQKTFDRMSDDMVVVFDKEKWHGLDKRTRARLESIGLVKVERRTITGQSPKVVVRLT